MPNDTIDGDLDEALNKIRKCNTSAADIVIPKYLPFSKHKKYW